MELLLEQTDGAAIITVMWKELDAHTAGDFRNRMAPVVQEHPQIILDLGPVHFLDSSGLGAILSLLKKVRSERGELRICNASSPVRKLFELVRFHRIVDIFNTREEAVRSLRAQAPSGQDGP